MASRRRRRRRRRVPQRAASRPAAELRAADETRGSPGMIDPVVIWIAALAASLIFAASAAMKLRNLELFESAVINYRIVPEAIARPVAWLIPLGELAGALALPFPAWRAAGA